MAINIYSGSSNSGKKSKVNSAAQSSRAQNAKSALTTPAETSASGNTAVSTKGTLGKVGNAIGKVAGVASKFLPGLGGTIAKGISNIFNDPEWWQSVPGDAITLNEPLRLVTTSAGDNEIFWLRSAILDVASIQRGPTGQGDVIAPTEQMITQYLMPQIRKVVNAVPLQDATNYNKALRSAANLYAMWRQLKKIDYMCKHGQTYLASMNDDAFPLFKTENAAWLQATINRLEEYLRANIRIPHTLCEYLAWRFGRVYKSNDSAKSALILYNVLGLECETSVLDQFIALNMNVVAGDPAVQRANTDIYNTYFDHDYLVEVRDDTQFRFDKKEFMLRLNLQANGDTDPTLVAIDSALDNPTAFMASTVSTTGIDQSGASEQLFPVGAPANVYVPKPVVGNLNITTGIGFKIGDTGVTLLTFAHSYVPDQSAWKTSANWMQGQLSLGAPVLANTNGAIVQLILSKAVDLYNCKALIPLQVNGADVDNAYVDVSALSIDAGQPTQTTINTEHIYAFANLVDIDRKQSMSYKQAEKQVARDTADLIDKLDVGVSST